MGQCLRCFCVEGLLVSGSQRCLSAALKKNTPAPELCWTPLTPHEHNFLSILHTFPSLLFILATFSRKPLFPLLTVTFPLVFLPLHLGLCHVLCWVVVFHTQNLSFLRWYMIHDLNVCLFVCLYYVPNNLRDLSISHSHLEYCLHVVMMT